MELYVNFDLNKALLNTAKLVKKPVQVRGKNGKVFTRMQWVSPAEASSGMGIRMINSKKGWEDAKKDGIHHHPDYHQALKDQGVHEDTFEDHHPHFFLPETEDSYNNRNDRMDELEKKHGFGAVVDAGEHEHSYDHEFEPPDHVHKVYNEFHFVPREKKETDIDDDKFMQEHGIHPEVHAVAKSIEALPLNENDRKYNQLRDIMTDVALNHWHTIKSHVEDKIRNDLPDDDYESKFIRNVQLSALKNGDMNHILNMAHHPIVARATVDKLLGKDTANQVREHIKDACLSVNFPGKHREAIEKDGYKSSQLVDYVENNMGEAGLVRLGDIMADHDDFEDQIKAIRDLPDKDGNYSWYDVAQRAEAEYHAIGLNLEDRKPTYVALNPTNSEFGAANFYGNRWLKVNPDILKYCTATLDDSFNTSKSFSKIWSMEHLKDMFILKQIDRGEMGDTHTSGWTTNWGDIPIELHYHKPELSTDQFEVMPDPADIAREQQNNQDKDEDYDNWDDLDLDEDEMSEEEMEKFLFGDPDEDELSLDDDDDLDLEDLDDDDFDLDDLDDLDLDDDALDFDNLFKDEKKDKQEDKKPVNNYDDLPF